MIKIALIGYGYWGPNVARNLYKNKEYDFAAICDKKPERLEIASKVYANAVSYIENYKEIMENPEIEAGRSCGGLSIICLGTERPV